MAESKPDQPIVVKRITAAHGHHGGSWKVAFADFATAMMAFFLLMWILNQSTEQQKSAISSYFNNPAAVDLGGAQGVSGEGPGPADPQSQLASGESEAEQLRQLSEQVQGTLESLEEMEEFRDRVKVEMTPEGVRIQIMDKGNQSMFGLGSAELEPGARRLLHELAHAIATVPNRISISGHTDALPFGSVAYSNWELSTDRANTARREFLAAGLDPSKIGRVVGLASTALLLPEQPTNPMNRRITSLVMNRRTVEAIRREGGQLVNMDH